MRIMYYKKERCVLCPICLNKFKTKDVRVKYCSKICAAEAKHLGELKTRKKSEKKNIIKYNKLFKKTKSSKIEFKCKTCGKNFKRYKSQVKARGVGYCSAECRIIGQMSKKTTDKQLVKLWSEVVKIYDHNKCAYCGKDSYLNSHHIFSRSNKSTRYDLDNGITLCAGCHTLSSKFSAHKTPVEFIEWLKEKRGEEWYQRLRKKAKSIKKFTKDDLEKIKYNFLEIKKHNKDGVI